MKNRFLVIGALSVVAGTASAFPLFPTITSHDINFGAFNSDGIAEYKTNGGAADTLIYTGHAMDTEATAYWPAWPSPPVHPIFNAGGAFGGDFQLGVCFTDQDAPYVGPGGVIDVSLTGFGLFAGADLRIMGAIPSLGIGYTSLWEIDLRNASLYGVSDRDSYVLEGEGIITGGVLAIQGQVLGTQGVMRGNLDFVGRPPGWIPPIYHPLQSSQQLDLRAAYSGETGAGSAVPEPATVVAVLVGFAGLARKRRKRS